jgi:hypothetical protein
LRASGREWITVQTGPDFSILTGMAGLLLFQPRGNYLPAKD